MATLLVLCSDSDDYRRRAALSDDFGGLGEPDAATCFVGVARGRDWPFLVVMQNYSPTGRAGFHPGVLLVPEAQRLFIGAGCRLLAYDLVRPARLWQDGTDCGFRGWHRHGPVVLMVAELELAAWDISGSKLWTRYVEPPWDYRVSGSAIALDVMGTVSRIDLRTGEPG